MPAWLIILITVAALTASISVDEEVYFYVFSVFFLFPALIFCALFAQPRPIFVRISEFLGDISYPIYALHVPFFCVFSSIIVLKFSWTWFAWWRIMGLAYFIPLLVLAYVMGKTYDRWAQSLLRNLQRPNRVQKTVVPN